MWITYVACWGAYGVSVYYASIWVGKYSLNARQLVWQLQRQVALNAIELALIQVEVIVLCP